MNGSAPITSYLGRKWWWRRVREESKNMRIFDLHRVITCFTDVKEYVMLDEVG